MSSTEIPGIKNIYEDYDTFIFDAHGVLVDSSAWKPFEHSQDCVEQLKKAGKKCFVLSNTHCLNDAFSERLIEEGFDTSCFDGVVTAGSAWDWIVKQNNLHGKKAFYIADKDYNFTARAPFTLCKTLEEADVVLIQFYMRDIDPSSMKNDDVSTINDVDAIQQCCDNLRKANEKGLPLCASSADILDVLPNGLVRVCSGAFIKFYEKIGGKTVVGGKQSPLVFDFIKDKFELGSVDKSRVLMIGDNPCSDIAFACSCEFDSVLITHPEHSASSLSANHRDDVVATYTMPDLKW